MQNITFRVFKCRNFRLFFPGLIISQIGIWVQKLAIIWLIYDMAKTPLLMGLSLFISSIPLIFFTPFAGAIIDKYNKHRLLIIIQILFLIQAFIFIILFYTHKLALWNIIPLCFFLNILLASDAPLRQALFVSLVNNKNDLTNAISINSSCFNLVKILGPSISGLIIANLSCGVCFITTFMCILPNIFLVILLKIEEKEKKSKRSIINKLIDGLKYVARKSKILYIQLFLAVFCFLIMVYPMMFPIYVKDIYLKNADTLGIIMGMIGFGALCSSLIIASKKDNKNLKAIMMVSCVSLCLCFALFAFVKDIRLVTAIAFLMGLSVTGFITPQISILQSLIANAYRGRVMSLNSFCILGVTAISTAITGSVIQFIGIRYTFLLYGLILLAFAVFFGFKVKES